MLALLVACTALFALRVVGQLVVVVAAPRWLPPMEGWQSGLLPYPVLLAAQLAIIAAQVGVVAAVARGGDALANGGLLGLEPSGQARLLVVLAAAYATGMAYRARRRLRFERPRWWSRGTIPIVFHFVLATFLAAWGVHALT